MQLPVRPAAETRSVAPISAPPPLAPSFDHDPDERSVPLSRRFRALLRYSWLLGLLTLVGAVAGLAATRFVTPTYEARSTVWIQEVAPEQSGPMLGREMLTANSWVELFKSFTIVDAVVMQLGLHIKPGQPRDSSVLSGLTIGERLRPNSYVLTVDQSGSRYTLATAAGRVVETGAVGGPIGRTVGLEWQPPAEELSADRTIAFTVTTPRDASMSLLNNVKVELQYASNFMRLTLTGDDPDRTAAALNLWTRVFVNTALELKRRNLTEIGRILEGQLRYAERQLRDAESQLLRFRVNTVTMPAEREPVIPGLEVTQGPVFSSYFERKQQLDEIRRQRAALEQALANGRTAGPDPLALASIPGLLEFAGSRELSDVWKELYEKQATLRSLQRTLTDENPRVQALEEEITAIRTQALPRLTGGVLTQLRTREQNLERQIQAQGQELRGIPSRTIEEMRLTREVKVAENLYTTLQTRYAEAKLDENSSVPDVVSLDQAIPPDSPSADAKFRVLGLGVGGAFVIGLILALLLDQRDHRFRYPDQVESDLHLPIIGAVPSLKPGRGGSSLVQMDAVVESFRGIRLRLQHTAPPDGRVVCAITSALSGDGKSIISANLALSFAETGYRTVLVDGDTRRGVLNDFFNVKARPGLVEALSGNVPLDECLQPTTHPQLTLLPAGARGRSNPEALSRPSLGQLIAELRSRYDAVIVDSPALTAGIDAFALSSECGNALLVLRCAKTDVRATLMKLEMLRRLPINIHGVVLNEVQAKGEYRYFAYEPAYDGIVETNGNGTPVHVGSGNGTVTVNRVIGG